MTVPLEIVSRSLLFIDLIFLSIFPAVSYILKVKNTISFVVIIFTDVFFAGAIFYAVMAIITTGYVENANNLTLNIPNEIIKRCYICQQVKPERTHHCKICRKCVKKMDHHCNVLGTCINYFNHGHFIRFIIFTFLGHLTLFLYNIGFILNAIFYPKYQLSYKFCIYICVITLVCGFAVFVTSYHLNTQRKLIIENITSIEDVQRYNSRHRKLEVGVSPYNYGIYDNLESIFGPSKFLFLWKPSENGIEFKKTYETWYWPLYDYAVRNVEEI